MARYFKKAAVWMLCAAFFTLHSLLLTSCQEGGDAGDLLGMWRVKRLSSTHGGYGSYNSGYYDYTTLFDERYISFSGSIVQFHTVTPDNVMNSQIFGKFQHVGDSLFIQCYSINDSQHDIDVVENLFGFYPFSNIRVKLKFIGDNAIQLTDNNHEWILEKW
jgi:hypothetical protein